MELPGDVPEFVRAQLVQVTRYYLTHELRNHLLALQELHLKQQALTQVPCSHPHGSHLLQPLEHPLRPICGNACLVGDRVQGILQVPVVIQRLDKVVCQRSILLRQHGMEVSSQRVLHAHLGGHERHRIEVVLLTHGGFTSRHRVVLVERIHIVRSRLVAGLVLGAAGATVLLHRLSAYATRVMIEHFQSRVLADLPLDCLPQLSQREAQDMIRLDE